MEDNALTVDFVIVTALQEELRPLLELFPHCTKLDKEHGDTHTYYEKIIDTDRRDGAKYRIILTCMANMGPTNSAITAAAIMKWKPETVLLVGICGGLKGETNLGDVLIADQIADDTLGKIAADKTRSIRWHAYPADANLLDSANNLIDGWQDLIRISRPQKGDIPIRRIGTIVSGGNVIGCADVLTDYRRQWPKLLGVEMEGGGLSAALNATPEKPGLLMVKAVSDHADKHKNSRRTSPWREYACSAAAAYTAALLRGGPIAKPNKKKRKSSNGAELDFGNVNANLEEKIVSNANNILGRLSQIERKIDSSHHVQIMPFRYRITAKC